MNTIHYKFLISIILVILGSGCSLDLKNIFNFSSKDVPQKPSYSNKKFRKNNKIFTTDRNLAKSTNKESFSAITKETTDLTILKDLANNYKYADAMFKLGEIYLHGKEGVNKDPALAKTWFLKAANHGVSAGMFELGNMARDGIGEAVSLPTAINYYEKAANLGNVHAILALGDIYCGVDGMQPNYNVAMEYYSKAAGMGSLVAEYQMSRLITNQLIDQKKYTVKIDLITKSLHQAADHGDPIAMTILGDHYASRNNFKLAVEYYQKAADKSSGSACLKLGILYFNGEFIEKNYPRALKYFIAAANLKEIAANYYLGEMYSKGIGVEINSKLAIDYYTVAVNKKFIKALGRLADLHFLGKGREPDLYKAIELYTKAANYGDSYSSFILSVLYAKGIGVEQNLSNSVYWYNLGVKQPDQLISKFNIARSYEMGLGLKKNYSEAMRWYLSSAEGGFAKAQVKLGDLYASDLINDTPDYNQAIFWYKKAANQGYNYAYYSLGLLLQSNSSSNIYKPSVAYSFMKKAALNGYKPAQYSLALMYLKGIGTNNNYIKAYCWLSIALSSDGGYGSDPELMDLLINKLDFKAREKAVALEQRYREKQKNIINTQF